MKKTSYLLIGTILLAGAGVFFADRWGEVFAGSEQKNRGLEIFDVIGGEPRSNRLALRGSVAPAPYPEGARNGGDKKVGFYPFFRSLHRIGEGKRLLELPSGLNAHADKGRVIFLRSAGFSAWDTLNEGALMGLVNFEGGWIWATANLIQKNGGTIRVGGELTERRGTFFLTVNLDSISGIILFPDRDLAWEIRTEKTGEICMLERRMGSVICTDLNPVDSNRDMAVGAPSGMESGASADLGLTIRGGAQVPWINTRPGAQGVAYLDFDGETVTDPVWNSGKTIEAEKSDLTASQIREIIERVREDYAPFDLTFTTDRTIYEAAPAGRRMRLIVTSTTLANPFSWRVEGIAYTHSWRRAGGLIDPGNSGAGVFRPDVPAWVFDMSRSAKVVAEVVSHELGHTLGLSHDGFKDVTTTVETFEGFNGELSSPVGWAPIMGKPYFRQLTQWSRGEYVGANNTEDDVAIIGGALNGFSLVAPSASESGALPLVCVANEFNVSGLIRDSRSVHRFSFVTSGGSFSATVQPATPVYTNLDVRMDLLDRWGRVLLSSDLADSTGAALGGFLEAGSYQFEIKSSGRSEPTPSGYSSGYSAYGSLGEFRLLGFVSGVSQQPFFSKISLRLKLGESFSERIVANQADRLDFEGQQAPAWIKIDYARGEVSGIAESPGTWELPLVASNTWGTSRGTLRIDVTSGSPALGEVIGSSSVSPWTSPDAPWSTVLVRLSDGRMGWTVSNGPLANRKSSSLRFLVVSQGAPGDVNALIFRCKTSTEFSRDHFECRVNGRIAMDLDTGKPVRISGESDWGWCKVHLPSKVAWVELRYTKDATLAEGLDRVWAYDFHTGILPSVKIEPRAVRLSPSGNLELSAQASGAEALQWTLDAVALEDSVTGGKVVSGSSAERLEIRNVGVLESGEYRLEARNGFGRMLSAPVRVQVSGPPAIAGVPSGNTVVREGGMLILAPRVAGSPPLTCVWKKDGRVVQVSSSPVFQRARVSPSSSGVYVITVSNRLGSESSSEIRVTVQRP